MTNSTKYKATLRFLYIWLTIDVYLFIMVMIGFVRNKTAAVEAYNYYLKMGYYLIAFFVIVGPLISYLRYLQNKPDDVPADQSVSPVPNLETKPAAPKPKAEDPWQTPELLHKFAAFNQVMLLPVGLCGLGYLYLLTYLGKSAHENFYYGLTFVFLLCWHFGEFVLSIPDNELPAGTEIKCPVEMRKYFALIYAQIFLSLGVAQMLLFNYHATTQIRLITLAIAWFLSSFVLALIVTLLLNARVLGPKK